ncbi:MAG: glycosyltransferase [Ignavibacteria bacterium]|nr:glycosyltransferase [Ignavibacteria bacterium]
MKIAIIGTAFPMRGAMAQLNGILANYLSKENEVEIFSFKRQYPKLLFPGKTQEDTSNVDIIDPKIRNTQIIDSIDPLNWRKSAKLIAKSNPDLLILRFWIPFFAPAFYSICKYVKKKTGAKVMFICDNVIPHEHRIGDETLIKLIFKVGDYFMIHSKSVENDLLKFSKGKPFMLSPHPVYNIFGPATGKTESREVIKEKFGIDLGNEKVILFFGYIRRYKGLPYLINAMKEINAKMKVKLMIVGEFYEDEKPTHDLIDSLGLKNDIFVISDYIPNEEVKYFFCASDVLVLPYIDATQSGIIQIAYYYDKPVIATNVGGLGEVVIDGKTGFVVEPRSSKSIADAIIEYYDKDLEKEFSANVAEEKKKYSWEEFITNIMKLVDASKN